MGQHYTKDTVEVSHWCNGCAKMTMWRVLGGKLAFCIPCYKNPSVVKPVKVKEAVTQGCLF
jgi:hypothetical protein